MKITKPTLLIDKTKCLENIRRMAEKAKASGASLRPHFKTHHSAEIGNWYRDFGVTACTVSSVSMAQYFARNGWNDVTIAFPYNPLESEEVSELAQVAALNILVESEEALSCANELIQHPVGYFIKLDMGTHRTGIDPGRSDLIQTLVSKSSTKVSFKGFVAHAGHTYSSTPSEIEQIYHQSIESLQDLKAEFGGILSYGDTPSCSKVEDFSGVDEVRAGNFIFYDWMQHEIGSCSIDNIAVCIACPVVAIHQERNEVVIYGGGVHFSKDHVEENGSKCFGKVVPLVGLGWKNEIIGNVKKLSQEHGILEMSDEQIALIKVGDLIGVIPVHSCLAADLQGHYVSTEGKKIKKIVKK